MALFGAVEIGEGDLVLGSLGLKGLDALGDEDGVDAGLDGGELAGDAPVELGDFEVNAVALVGVVVVQLVGEGSVLGAEVGEAVGPEDVRGEEAVDERQQAVLAHVLPFAVSECGGGPVAVGDAVAAGVVGDPFALLAVHAQRVVAGGAMHDAAQQVGALLRAATARPFGLGALGHLALDALEPVVGNERVVAALGFDPLFVAATDDGPFALLGGAEVEAVPDQAAGVDGVLQQGADGGLGPLARGVALVVDVVGWSRAARPVEVVGDLLEAPAGQVALKDLGDDWRLVCVGYEPGLLVALAGAPRVGVGLVLEPVAVGGAAAVAIALAGVLGLSSAHLAPELLNLELIQRLEEVADEPPLGARLVAGAQRVEHLDAGAGELALVGQGVKEITAQTGGGVDDDGVKAPHLALLGLTDELAPPGAVVTAPGFLVGEVAHDPAAELGGLGDARLAL